MHKVCETFTPVTTRGILDLCIRTSRDFAYLQLQLHLGLFCLRICCSPKPNIVIKLMQRIMHLKQLRSNTSDVWVIHCKWVLFLNNPQLFVYIICLFTFQIPQIFTNLVNRLWMVTILCFPMNKDKCIGKCNLRYNEIKHIDNYNVL